MDLAKFKNQLEKERVRLENELSEIGTPTRDNPNDWQHLPADTSETTFRDEVADRLEEISEREATEVPLERRLANVKSALEKIAGGSYGRCEVCDEPIETDRLAANPAAKTCKKHMASSASD